MITHSFSIVSHGQGVLVVNLLNDLKKLQIKNYEIILTFNILEDEDFLKNFNDLPIIVIRNKYINGFGSNHNSAFKNSSGKYFYVLNPDIRIPGLKFDDLIQNFNDKRVGVVAPIVYSANGAVEDSFRKFPTVYSLLRRKLFHCNDADYSFSNFPITVDWVAGMMMIIPRSVYIEIKGFDEKYFMYFEDVDLCLKINSINMKVVLDPRNYVIHDAQRASRKKFQYFIWHLKSAFRFLKK